MSNTTHIADIRAITRRQQATWAAGDFNVISRLTMPMSEALVQAVDPHAGECVLDIACGSGNTALVVGRRFCDVTGIDYVPELIERARMRADAESLQIDFRVGDAQALPFPDASFDVVLSVIGVMFAPDQERAASELLRVCRPGARIGLACWMPEAFGGDFFAAHARYAPPPRDIAPPARWGTGTGLKALIGAGVGAIEIERRRVFAYFRSASHAVEVHRTHFGPTISALEKLDAGGRRDLLKALEEVFSQYNNATDGTAKVAYEYLQAIAIRARS